MAEVIMINNEVWRRVDIPGARVAIERGGERALINKHGASLFGFVCGGRWWYQQNEAAVGGRRRLINQTIKTLEG